MDNLSAHKSPATVRLLEEVGAQVWYLPPYSPDMNPFELMCLKVKTALRSAKARTEDELHHAIAAALTTITPDDTRDIFGERDHEFHGRGVRRVCTGLNDRRDDRDGLIEIAGLATRKVAVGLIPSSSVACTNALIVESLTTSVTQLGPRT